MHVVITGGAGFIGKKLASALLARGALETASGRQTIERITLFDVAEAEGLPDDPRLTSIAGNITDLAEVHRAIRDDVGGVFHLAAIVSANAEEDFDLGVRVNLEGTRNVLEACRALPQTGPSGVRELGRGLRRRHAGRARRRHHPDAADLLRRPEGDRRAAAQRLQPQGLRGWPGAAPADHRRAPGPAEPGRLDLRQLDHPRAARRPGGDLPGRRARRPCTSCRPGAWSRP